MIKAGFQINDLPDKFKYLEKETLNDNAVSKTVDLNDLVHLNSYFITKK